MEGENKKNPIIKIGKKTMGASTGFPFDIFTALRRKKTTLLIDVEKTPFQIWDENISLS